MNTSDLVAALAKDVRPVASGGGTRRIAGALALGSIIALLAMMAFTGPPLAAVRITGLAPFAVKLAYTVAMAAVAAWLLIGAGQPGRRLGWHHAWLAVPPLLMAGAATMEMAGAQPGTYPALVLGPGWTTCLTSIAGLSLPVFAVLVRAFRRLAPTDLRVAGAICGLASGATASIVYALYCPATAAGFLVIWYTLAMAIAAAAGALLGPRLLRW